MKVSWNFQGGREVQTKKFSMRGVLVIFWNNTLQSCDSFFAVVLK